MNLKTTSLITSVIGILILLILSSILEPKLSNISELKNKQAYEKVRVQGQLTNQKTINPSFTILTVKDQTGSIDVLVNKNPEFKINSTLQVTGKITEYQNQNQITADKIKS